MMWYDTLVKLSNSDITKIEKITKLTAFEVLNYIMYLKIRENG